MLQGGGVNLTNLPRQPLDACLLFSQCVYLLHHERPRVAGICGCSKSGLPAQTNARGGIRHAPIVSRLWRPTIGAQNYKTLKGAL